MRIRSRSCDEGCTDSTCFELDPDRDRLGGILEEHLLESSRRRVSSVSVIMTSAPFLVPAPRASGPLGPDSSTAGRAVQGQSAGTLAGRADGSRQKTRASSIGWV